MKRLFHHCFQGNFLLNTGRCRTIDGHNFGAVIIEKR